jgi:hypothetical protein
VFLQLLAQQFVVLDLLQKYFQKQRMPLNEIIGNGIY